METAFTDDLHVLANALRYEGFRFILIGHNRYSLYVDIAKQLRNTFPDRPVLELRLRDKPYRQLVDEILAFPNGIILIPDFDWLLQPGNETVRVGFNQRRDAFARRNVAFICFIGPNSWRSVAEKIPDWWSIRSLELDFEREEADEMGEFLPEEPKVSSLGGQTKAEKRAEIERLEKQLAAVDPTNKPLIQTLSSQLGELWFELLAYETALPYLQQSLLIAQEIGDRRGEGRSLNNISQIYYAWGDYETALTYLLQSLSIQQEISDRSGEGDSLNNISRIYNARGDYETALTYLQQSLRIQQEIGDKRGEGATLNNISQIYKARGDYKTALTYLRQSLHIQQEIGDNRGEGTTLNNISQIYKARGDDKWALTYLQQSLRIQQEIGDKRGEGTTLNNISQIYKWNDETALTYLQQSLHIQQEIGDKRGEGTTLNNISQIYKARGDSTAVTYLIQQCLRIQQEIGDKRGEGSTLNNISQIYDARGNYETALTYLQQSLHISQEIGDKRGEVTTLNNISQIYDLWGHDQWAVTYLQQSLCIQQEIGDRSSLPAMLHNMGTIYFEQWQKAAGKNNSSWQWIGIGKRQDNQLLEQAIGLFWPAYEIFKQLGSPNTETTAEYLKAIKKQIGEDRFQAIVQSIPNAPSVNNL